MLTANEAQMRFNSAYNNTSNMLGQQITSIIVFTLHSTLDKVSGKVNITNKIMIKSLDDRIDIKKNKDIMI